MNLELFRMSEWLEPVSSNNTHTLFYGEWIAPETVKAELAFAMIGSADILFNGEPVKATQPDDLLPEISVTAVPINVKSGKNTLLVNLHAQGKEFSSHMTGNYGFAAIVCDGGKLLFRTSSDWKQAEDIRWSTKTADIDDQLGYTFEFDARKIPEWDKCRVNTVFKPQYIPRTLPVMKEECPPYPRVTACGFFRRENTAGTVAEQCWSDLLHPRLPIEIISRKNDKKSSHPFSFYIFYIGFPGEPVRFNCPDEEHIYVILDLGEETVGYLDFELEAEDGVVVDICHGEHLADGRVRCHVGKRNFADRYICKAGRNSFTSRMRRYGARYMELHFSGKSAGKIVLHRFSLIPVHAALPEEAGFHCSDNVLNRIRDVSLNTLDRCMHDHYEDCPWREQALYTYDSRNQALFGYGLWGNYAFARHSFQLLGKNELKRGLLRLVSPSRFPKTIPIFSFVWIDELREYQLYSGDCTLAQEFAAEIRCILDNALERTDSATQLIKQPQGEDIWNFFEWVPDLANFSKGDVIAPYNLYLAEALYNGEYLLPGNGYGKKAAALLKGVEKIFRDKDGFYRTSLDEKILRHWHTQALALFLGLPVPANFTDGAPDLVPLSFSALPYLVRALAKGTPVMRKQAERLIYSNYEPMLKSGAITFWETPAGESDFHGSGSLCHGWSALGAWYCQNIVLGIEPLEDGFTKFRIRPYPGCLDNAEGRIPTPKGFIAVQWQKKEKGLVLTVHHPKGLVPVLDSFPEVNILQAEIQEN